MEIAQLDANLAVLINKLKLDEDVDQPDTLARQKYSELLPNGKLQDRLDQKFEEAKRVAQLELQAHTADNPNPNDSAGN